MVSKLQSSPTEVVECISGSLDLQDVRSLRLACKALASKSFLRFRHFLKPKSTDITVDSLQSLVRSLGSIGLVSHIERIYVTGICKQGVVRPRLAENDPRIQELQLLTEAFNLFAKYGGGHHPSLTLRVALITQTGERVLPATDGSRLYPKPIWQCANQTYEVVLRALSQSSLKIRGLNIFNDADMVWCSVARNHLRRVDLADAGLADSLAPVESLSISICSPATLFHRNPEDEEEDPSKRRRLGNFSVWQRHDDNSTSFTGVPQLIKLCPQLCEFELHQLYIHFYRQDSQIFPTDEEIMGQIAKLDRLPILRRCRLRGVPARESDLLAIIKRTKVADLSLENMLLWGDDFRAILDFCTSPASKMARLYFDNIQEGCAHRIHFLGFGRSNVQWSPREDTVFDDPITGDLGNDILEMQGSGIVHPVPYRVIFTFHLTGPEDEEWRRSRRLEYGFCY